jgi:hypothetical protein
LKLVKEILYEKFTENDSDPIHDMGIGISVIIDKFPQKIRDFLGTLHLQYRDSDNGNWDNSNSGAFRFIKINENEIEIALFRNIYRNKDNHKEINKISLAKKLLKYANISTFIEKEYYIELPTGNYLPEYENNKKIVKIIFKIKDGYVHHFDKFSGKILF